MWMPTHKPDAFIHYYVQYTLYLLLLFSSLFLVLSFSFFPFSQSLSTSTSDVYKKYSTHPLTYSRMNNNGARAPERKQTRRRGLFAVKWNEMRRMWVCEFLSCLFYLFRLFKLFIYIRMDGWTGLVIIITTVGYVTLSDRSVGVWTVCLRVISSSTQRDSRLGALLLLLYASSFFLCRYIAL